MTIPFAKTEFSSYIYDWPSILARSRLGAAVAAAARLARLWVVRAEGRRALRRLDLHLLRDIGLTRAQAQREAGKPFWER